MLFYFLTFLSYFYFFDCLVYIATFGLKRKSGMEMDFLPAGDRSGAVCRRYRSGMHGVGVA